MFKKAISIGTFLVATSMFNTVQAKDFAVKTPACATNFGSAYVERTNSIEVYKKAGANDPAGFVEAMVADSGCFSVTSDRNAANFIISTGLLTQKQYESRQTGSTQSDTRGALDTLLTVDGLISVVSSGSMRYSFLQVDDRATGNLISRGFGRNNTSGLDYSSWSLSSSQKAAVNSFNNSKKARLISGSVINAYFDIGPEKASSSTYQSTRTSQYAPNSAAVETPTKTIGVDTSVPEQHSRNQQKFVELKLGQQTLAGLQLGMTPDQVDAILRAASYQLGEDQYNPNKYADTKSPSYATLLAATKKTGHFGGGYGLRGRASQRDTIASMKRFKNNSKELVEVYFLPLEQGPRVSRVVYGTWATNTITKDVFFKRVVERFGEPTGKAGISNNPLWQFGAEEIVFTTSSKDYRIILDDGYTSDDFREDMMARFKKEAVPTETTF